MPGVWILVRIVIPLVLAVVAYRVGRKRGEDAAELWAVVIGGFGYLTWTLGGLVALGIFFVQSDRSRADRRGVGDDGEGVA